jgi:hypothetical protein
VLRSPIVRADTNNGNDAANAMCNPEPTMRRLASSNTECPVPTGISRNKKAFIILRRTLNSALPMGSHENEGQHINFVSGFRTSLRCGALQAKLLFSSGRRAR